MTCSNERMTSTPKRDSKPILSAISIVQIHILDNHFFFTHLKYPFQNTTSCYWMVKYQQVKCSTLKPKKLGPVIRNNITLPFIPATRHKKKLLWLDDLERLFYTGVPFTIFRQTLTDFHPLVMEKLKIKNGFSVFWKR